MWCSYVFQVWGSSGICCLFENPKYPFPTGETTHESVTPDWQNSYMKDTTNIRKIQPKSPKDWMSSYGAASNNGAARATEAWLTGRGLSSVAKEIQSSPLEYPLPAPGRKEALRQLGDACAVACEASSRTFKLLNGKLKSSTKPKVLELHEVIVAAADESELWMRRLAQLCGGLSTHRAGSKRMARADRALVMALKNGDNPIDLVDDGLWHNAATFDEFSVELAGDLVRMVIDHDCCLSIEHTDAHPRFRIACIVDPVGDVTVELECDMELDRDALIELGWSDEGGRIWARYEDPMWILRPVELIKATLTDHLGVQSPGELALSIER